MKSEFAKKVLDANHTLLTLPQVMSEIIRLASDINSSISKMVQVIEKDPTLTTRILKIANSPLYGMNKEISTVKRAVQMIGTREITTLALSTSVYGLLKGLSGAIDKTGFWRHSLEVAIAARLIAEKVGFKKSDESFVSGLLHDIGLLIIEKALPEQFDRIWKRAEQVGGLLELEHETWETNHAHVGRYLLERWNLPDSICEPIGRHHSVFIANDDNKELIPSQIIRLAHIISRFSFSGETESNSDSQVNLEIIRKNLGLAPENLVEIENMLFDLTIEEAAYLDIDIGSSEELVSEAKRLLHERYVTISSLLKVNEILRQKISDLS
jgi:putative nucleotidyltransferase with HDIG domain